MGRYNPSAPIILGNEWVGIRNENTQFSPSVSVVEEGHTFNTAQSYTLQDGRFYINEMPGNTGEAIYTVNLYPYATMAETGPVKRVVIPTETVFVTGAILSGGSALQAMSTPYFGNYLLYISSVAQALVVLGFNTAPYTVLNGKRIVGVNFLSGMFRTFDQSATDTGPRIYLSNTTGQPTTANAVEYEDGSGVPRADSTADLPPAPMSTAFGEMNRLWQSPFTTEIMPWNFSDLLRFDSSTGGTKLYVSVGGGSNFGMVSAGLAAYLWYAALEVLYCEETRLIVGGVYKSDNNEPTYGANVARLRDITTRGLLPVLPAGQYAVTVTAADQGSVELPRQGYPDLNALRELYQISSHEGVEFNVTRTPGQEFSLTQTSVLTQLSVHASGGPLTEVHAYGRQYPAPVYGSVTAVQDIYDNLVGGTATFPQIRFWARHWTGTVVPLTVSGTGGVAGSVASIAVSDFDALPDILDGWKEVNLRFPVAPTMGALSPEPTWVWSAAGESAGSRWEVLSVWAPAVSGMPGDYLQQVLPASQRLDTATYEPPVGSSVELTTLTWYASGGTSPQIDMDISVLFSQDPYTVTGHALTTLSQALTGIGEGCDGEPCCMVTSLLYNRVTWPTLEMPVTGFGAFEMQRYDAIVDEWQTIMYATDPTLTGFNDYEARVGVESRYRIRVLNLYLFAGAWSSELAITITAPGVVVQCTSDPSGVLIFTSNEVQAGVSNLAYVESFARSIEEPFDFPEASRRQLRWMYDRDFQTAYRPTERGGEAFSRAIQIQGAAGALPNMANMRSLRDLAWADLAYVCVRDELGNRWFANVNVPSGNISMRSLYIANVDITEISATPTEVDP